MKHEIKKLIENNSPLDNISISGWVMTRRDSKFFSFVEINDGTTVKNIQVIADSKLSNYESEVKKLTLGASVKIVGDLVKSQGKGQNLELQAKEVLVYGFSDPLEYPLQKNSLELDYLRSFVHLRPRTRLFGAIFRVRSELAFAIHKFYNERGFFYIHTPLITGSDCEGAGSMFQVTTLDIENLPRKKESKKIDYEQDFFEKKAYLTVSGQLEGEFFATAISKIYTFGPTFRAEKSTTYRHAAEFWMIEPEMAFYELDDLMNLEEEFIKYLIDHMLKVCKDDIEYLNEKIDNSLIERLNHILNLKFIRLDYTKAVEILIASGKEFENKVEWGVDLASEHERYLTEEHFKGPVIVYNYPKDIKSFYMKQNDDGKTVRGTDVLVPRIGEIIGGSQREESLEKLQNRIRELKLDEKSYNHYLDTRRFGTVPHSGFGLGFERMLMLVTGVSNIRDVTPIPRNYKQMF